jgi:hypothetical protein
MAFAIGVSNLDEPRLLTQAGPRTGCTSGEQYRAGVAASLKCDTLSRESIAGLNTGDEHRGLTSHPDHAARALPSIASGLTGASPSRPWLLDVRRTA